MPFRSLLEGTGLVSHLPTGSVLGSGWKAFQHRFGSFLVLIPESNKKNFLREFIRKIILDRFKKICYLASKAFADCKRLMPAYCVAVLGKAKTLQHRVPI
jgi:hypothetical protein